MNRYKFTDHDLKTYDRFQWKVGVWRSTKSKMEERDAEGFIVGDYDESVVGECYFFTCYDSPLLAVLLTIDYPNPRLWIVETKGQGRNIAGVAWGYQDMRLVEEIPLPKITITQRVAFAILCAKSVYVNLDNRFHKWADDWLSGKDRTPSRAGEIAREIRPKVDFLALDDGTFWFPTKAIIKDSLKTLFARLEGRSRDDLEGDREAAKAAINASEGTHYAGNTLWVKLLNEYVAHAAITANRASILTLKQCLDLVGLAERVVKDYA